MTEDLQRPHQGLSVLNRLRHESNRTEWAICFPRLACIFRAGGTAFNVDAFVQSSSLDWDEVWHIGEVKAVRRAGRRNTSGVQKLIADGDNFDTLVAEAAAFLKAHSTGLARVASTDGVEFATFDFGLTWDPSHAARYVHLPAEMVKLAAAAGCSLEVSFYDLR